ncbi:MAG: hypothetical protein ACJ8F7_17800 [Gemmataceae bacterium]
MSSSQWSFNPGTAVRGLALARETELLLIRGENHTLTLLNARGSLQGQTRRDGLSAADISDDGSAIAAASADGHLWWLALDLTNRWEARLPAGVLAVALDMFGQYVVATDKKGGLHLFDRTGRPLGQFECPRPLQFLAFIPTLAQLAASAAFGWAGCLDLGTGEWVWSDRPVSNAGALAVAAGGDPLLLACFSDGVRRYGAGGNHRGPIKLPKPCGLVALDFAGEKGVAAGASRELFGFDIKGEVTFTRELPDVPVALALSARGDRLVCGLANGVVQALKL